jgi:hypothetical protein
VLPVQFKKVLIESDGRCVVKAPLAKTPFSEAGD